MKWPITLIGHFIGVFVLLKSMGLLLISASLGATTFQVQNVEQQLKSADGVMIGHYLKRRSIVLENGSLATQMIFKMNREYGLQSDFFGMDEIIVHFPGGKVADRETRIEGVPDFVSGEKIALLIKNVQNRYWGLNLGMGSFRVINYGKKTMLINSLFPENPHMGQISLEDFEKSVRDIKKSNLKTVYSSQFPVENNGRPIARLPASVEEGKNRSIASKVDKEENDGDRSNVSTFWLISVLALSGGLFRFLRKKSVR